MSFATGSGAKVEAECVDISLGGAFLRTAEPAPFGSKVKVWLRLPGVEDEVEVESIVRWTKPEGMGVQFGVMGARETHALVTLLSGE